MTTDTALLLIDVQDSFLHMPYWSTEDLPAFRERMLALLALAQERHWPVVRILHAESAGPFSPESGHVRPMAWLPEGAAATFTKHVHNAFTDTGLEAWLRAQGIRRVLVAGIRTEQCCETTARVASDLGFEVDFVSEATLTFAMTHKPSGRRYEPAAIRERTELVLDGRFARIRSVQQLREDDGHLVRTAA